MNHKMIRIAWGLVGGLTLANCQTYQSSGAREDKTSKDVFEIVLSVVGLVLICVELVVYVRETRLASAIKFTLFKQEVFQNSEQKFSSFPETDVKSQAPEIKIKNVPQVEESPPSRRKRKRKADRLRSPRDGESPGRQNESVESNAREGDEY